MGHTRMDEYDRIEQEFMDQHPGYATPVMQMHQHGLQLYELPGSPETYPLAQTPAPEPIYQRRLAGIPVWGWGLGALGALGALYFYTQQRQVTKNGEDSSESGEDSSSARLPSGWQPSRSAFGDRLRSHLQKNGLADKTTIWTDADEAQKKLKQVSPLVTIQCKATKIPLAELDKFAKREGLSAVSHTDGVVGFYPGGGKKGKQWEEYIDALREEGQKV